jgi:two-component sensor histidine kinase
VTDVDGLVRDGAHLPDGDRRHLRALLADWQMLADLSFSDLLLWVPLRPEAGAWPEGHRAVAQIRPSTGPTVFADDWVGQMVRWGERPHVDLALSEERISRDRDTAMRAGDHVVEEAIPVMREGRAIAVISRYSSPTSARTPSRLELVYLQTANDLAQMVAAGRFPDATIGAHTAPRVGDGLLRLDSQGAITYASPNAASALRRLGAMGEIEGSRLGAVVATIDRGKGPTDEGWTSLLSGRAARLVTAESGTAVVDLRVIPLIPVSERIGAIVLIHDVTEINRRDRELVTKTATIREIHHRVKNNLQTVAALLRLQARRVDDLAARQALEEAVRRVGSIAIVHETLSSAGSDDDVAFDEVADRIIEMLGQVAARPSVRVARVGAFGDLASTVATPLSMVVNELISNALEHGVADVGSEVRVSAEREGDHLTMEVQDDGAGLPEGFDAAASTSLGLQIVRTLITHELGGEISFERRQPSGTRVRVHIPVR